MANEPASTRSNPAVIPLPEMGGEVGEGKASLIDALPR